MCAQVQVFDYFQLTSALDHHRGIRWRLCCYYQINTRQANR